MIGFDTYPMQTRCTKDFTLVYDPVRAKVMMFGFAGAEGLGGWRNFVSGWVPVIAIVTTLSLLLGNLVALVQSSVKRLLAYKTARSPSAHRERQCSSLRHRSGAAT